MTTTVAASPDEPSRGILDLVDNYRGLLEVAARDFSSDPMYATAIARAAMALTMKKTDM